MMLYEMPMEGKLFGHCKDCKFFEHDHFEQVGGVPLIVAHWPVVLSADEFKEFANAYREDFRRLKGRSDYFEEYMEELINSPGEKELLWC